jgi:hypothetical protein
MKTKTCLIGGICIAAIALCTPLGAQTTPGTATSPAASPHETASPAASPAKTRPIPFHGKASAVDQNAKTFTIAGKTTSRVFKVTDQTEITKGGNAATMSDITESEEVSGSYWKHDDGSLEAKTVKVGAKAEGEKKTRKSKKHAAEEGASPAASPEASPKP